MEEHNENRGICSASGLQKNFRLRCILALGLMFIVIGAFLLVSFISHSEKILFFTPVVLSLVGLVMLFIGLGITSRFLYIFIGLTSFLSGIFMLLICVSIIPVGIARIWPAFLIIAGLSLLPTGLYCYKKIRTAFLFPSIGMVVLGTSFLLFSLKVFRVSFRAFIGRWWPLLFICVGFALVILFLYQQSHQKDFPYMEEESFDEGEEF